MSYNAGLSLDLSSLSAQIKNGTITPDAVLDEVFARVERYADQAVWIDLPGRGNADDELARVVARKNQGLPQPLFGIPFAVKDNIDVAGRPTTAGCAAFAYTAAKSTTVVLRAG